MRLAECKCHQGDERHSVVWDNYGFRSTRYVKNKVQDQTKKNLFQSNVAANIARSNYSGVTVNTGPERSFGEHEYSGCLTWCWHF